MADTPESPVHDQLAQLAQAHHVLEQQLEDLIQHPPHSETERLRATALKKRKLALKDRMAALQSSEPGVLTRH
jgi:hypothetical protein